MRFGRVKRRARLFWLGCALSIVGTITVASAETVIPWDEAEKHVGEEVVVEGRILGVRCSQLSCLLAFDPTLSRFTAVVQAESFKDLPPEKLEQLYSGKQVRIRGKVVENERKPEIVLHSPSDVTLTAGERRRDRQEKETRRAQAEAETPAAAPPRWSASPRPDAGRGFAEPGAGSGGIGSAQRPQGASTGRAPGRC